MVTKDSVVDDVVAEVAGKDVVPLARILLKQKNVSEFKLAERIKDEVNATRNKLYRLYNANLVSFTRKKDKKKGWYIYYWTFNKSRVDTLRKTLQERNIERLQERLERERRSHFFICPSKCIRLDFEQATDFEYKCPECGNIMHQEDNAEKIRALEKEMHDIEKESSKKKK